MSEVKLIECPACGKKVSSKANSCPNCGHPLVEEKTRNSPQQAVAQSTPPPKKKTGSRCLSICLTIIGFIIICGTIGAFFEKGDKSNTTKIEKVETASKTFPFDELDFITDLSRSIQENMKDWTIKKLTQKERKEINLDNLEGNLYIVSSKNEVTIGLLIQNVDAKVKRISLFRGIKQNVEHLINVAVVVAARIVVLQGYEIKNDNDDIRNFSSYLFNITNLPNQEKELHCKYFATTYKSSDSIGFMNFFPTGSIPAQPAAQAQSSATLPPQPAIQPQSPTALPPQQAPPHPAPAQQTTPEQATSSPAPVTSQEPRLGQQAPTPPPAAMHPGPSFDCAKATTPVEHAICADPQLSRLDRAMAATYAQARRRGDRKTVTAEQRQWIQQRETECAGVPNITLCLQQQFTTRLQQLGIHMQQAPRKQ